MAWENPKQNWGQLGQTVPGVDDFNRIEGNIDILGKYDRAPGYGTATGTNAKTITLDPAPTSYYDGLCFAFKNATQNTGAVTINVNGMGAKPIKKPNGNDVAAGNLKAGSIYTVRYNGTNFILQGSDSSGNATPEHVLAGKTFSNDNDTGITGTMPNRGAINEIITVQGGQIIIPEGYHNGNGIVKANFANLIAGNVKSGVNIGGVVGTLKELVATIATNPVIQAAYSPSSGGVGNSYSKIASYKVFVSGKVIARGKVYGGSSGLNYYFYMKIDRVRGGVTNSFTESLSFTGTNIKTMEINIDVQPNDILEFYFKETGEDGYAASVDSVYILYNFIHTLPTKL